MSKFTVSSSFLLLQYIWFLAEDWFLLLADFLSNFSWSLCLTVSGSRLFWICRLSARQLRVLPLHQLSTRVWVHPQVVDQVEVFWDTPAAWFLPHHWLGSGWEHGWGFPQCPVGSPELCIWNLHLVLCEQIFLWLAVSGEVKIIGKRYCQDQALPVRVASRQLFSHSVLGLALSTLHLMNSSLSPTTSIVQLSSSRRVYHSFSDILKMLRGDSRWTFLIKLKKSWLF